MCTHCIFAPENPRYVTLHQPPQPLRWRKVPFGPALAGTTRERV